MRGAIVLINCQIRKASAWALMSINRVLITVFFVLLLGFLLGSWSHRASMPETAASSETIVATVGIRPITLAALERTLPLPLYMAAQQRQQLLLQGLQRLIDQELLATEASKRSISVSQLLDDASQSESIAKLANLPGPVRRLSTNKTRDGQREALPDPEQRVRIRQALLVALRRQSEIHITLPALEPPVLPVSADDDPRLGPDNAPVTIIEFSDFQCPFCQRSVGVLQEIRRIYGDKIRVVYRDFPGQNHPHAWPAAEAAQCAHEQGKFWEYHDLLFARQSPEKTWNFLALAVELHLQADAFNGCLNSGRFRAEIYKDFQDGLNLGIASTPTFFINGRPLVGAQPTAAFEALIDKALLDPQHP
jgi:protein-disulfide isomerase